MYRVSSRQQLHEDDIPMQRSECLSYLGKRSDWEFQKEYVEKAVSGYKKSLKERDVLLEILEDARQKTFDVLLVYMSDRIGRKEDESPAYVANLNRLGIEVWTVNEGQLKTEEHIDKLMNYIRFWQAEGESRKTGMRVRDAQIDMVRAGKFVGGKAPYGYDLVLSGEISSHGRALHKLVINEEQAAIVRKIYDYAVNWRYGAFKIAKCLNEEGITPIGEEWKCTTISGILKNPVYMGYIAYNRRANRGSYTRLDRKDWIYANEPDSEIAILSQSCWEKAQQIREARRSDRSSRDCRKCGERQSGEQNDCGRIRTTGTLALMGLAYCGYCGARLTNGSVYNHWTTKDGKKHGKISGRYKCTRRAGGSALCEGKAFYRQEELEGVIFDVIGNYLDKKKPENADEEIRKLQEKQCQDLEKEIEIIKKKRRSAESDIATLEEKIPDALRGQCLFTAEKLSALITVKEQEQKKMGETLVEKERELEKAESVNAELKEQESFLINWREEFHAAPTAIRKTILANLIERIEVKRDSVRIICRMEKGTGEK